MLSSSFRFIYWRSPLISAAVPLSVKIPFQSANFSYQPLSKISPFSTTTLRKQTCLTSSSSFFSRMSSSQAAASIHDFTVKDARGNDVDLGTYKGKVLLIVNVASQCGLTNSNYTELTKLYEKYKDQGLEILAFPCNQFGSEEPGSNEEIVEFACTRFKAEYPIFDKSPSNVCIGRYRIGICQIVSVLADTANNDLNIKPEKVDVNGDKASPIFKYLKSSKGGLFGDDIKWNFTKFLVDKEGRVVDRYAPTTSPLSIEKDIKKLLA